MAYDIIVKAFRKLRDEWFKNHLRSNAHEREWETEEHELIRESQNKELKVQFDQQTELTIAGKSMPIAPRCAYEMDLNQ